ncbi:hypothetical protein [Acinetobacter baumannii]|uniref:hypothetical protein n=1 Tax=Acinetobacter baumannii TaxID=470 RepID=UPI00071D619D|nr:hypothetical protein [Acinetobacter baumannii]
MSLKWSGLLMKHLGVAAILCMGLSACDVNHADSKDHSAVATTSRHEDSLIKSTTKVKTLDDAAGRTFLPEGVPDQTSKLSEAEYILNLLPDGTAYWNVVHFGRVGSKDGSKSAVINQLCPSLKWKVEPAAHELTIQCPLSDVNFYFDIDAKQRLVVNLEKLFYSDFGKNREFLEQNYFVPTKAYVLDKE